MGGGAAFGGGGHTGGGGRVGRLRNIGSINGYEEDWMAKTKKTVEDELRFRGIAPEVIAEISHKIEEPSCLPAIVISILVTALILTLVFVAIWESTP
jgi:hypothetical protein